MRMYIWVQYFLCAVVIFFAGTRLSRYGDVIAEKTGLSGTWIGVILMATVTSLPELVTGISSAAIFRLPDIAAGDALGSCMFNIFILSLLDVGSAPPISGRAHQGHVLSASFGILLLTVLVFALLAGGKFPAIGWIGIYSIILLVLYLVAMRMIFSYEKKRVTEFTEKLRYEAISKRKAFLLYGFYALLVVGAALYLPHLGERISEISGLGQTFVGNIFIAFSTSLPEIAVTSAAIRIGAVDMGVGNLFGSNLFNIAILAVDDFFYTPGPLLSFVTQSHMVTVVATISMTSVAVIGLTYRASRKTFLFSWDSLCISVFYFMAILILYFAR